VVLRLEREDELVDELMAELGEQLLFVEGVLFFGGPVEVFLLADLERIELTVVVSADEEDFGKASFADALDDGHVSHLDTGALLVGVELLEFDPVWQEVENLRVV